MHTIFLALAEMGGTAVEKGITLDAWTGAGAALAGAIIGGAITGYFTIAAAKRTHEDTLARDVAAREAVVQGFLFAIHDEMEAVFEFYGRTIGAQIASLGAGDGLFAVTAVSLDHFTVFHTNAGLIGQVRDADLRRQIVITYSRAKNLVEALNLNNQLVTQWESAKAAAFQNSSSLNLASIRDKCANDVATFADHLRHMHAESTLEVGKLLRLLRQLGAEGPR